EGMLFHALYAPGSPLYFQQASYRVTGALDVPALRRAWQTVVDRHGVLRTAFVWGGLSRPLPIVRRQVELPFPEEDWREAGAAVHGRLDALLADEPGRGFELDRPPLVRLRLLRLGDEEHELLWSHHHAVLDGWSRTLVIQELFSLYESYRSGVAPSLARPSP